jgi:predicted phosphoribosyltransferase
MLTSFENREDAANLLAVKLMQYRGRNPLILAIPRGAVPMGKILAEQLQGELDVVLVRKIGAPGNPEYAIGAVDESGWVYLTEAAEMMGVSHAYIEQEKRRQVEICKMRRKQYTPIKPPVDPAGRVVIVIDDGLATGATMIAALHAVRAKKPAELVCAVPVAASDSLEKIKPIADSVVCLMVPSFFMAVGQFYRNFSQVEDEEVEKILSE